MNPTSCIPCCTTPLAVDTPGSQGENAATTLTAFFIIPAVGATVAITVASTGSRTVGESLFISDGTEWGHFTVMSITDPSSMVVRFEGYSGDSVQNDQIGNGGDVVPSGTQPTISITALTDNTTGTATNTLAVGSGYYILAFEHTFIGGTAAVESVTNYTIGHKFKVISWSAVVNVVLAGAGGSRIANMEINGTDVGTVPSTITISIASATVGTVIPGTAVAGANTGSAVDTFSIEIANGGTAFSSGSVAFLILVQNMDTADSLASLAAKQNAVLTALA